MKRVIFPVLFLTVLLFSAGAVQAQTTRIAVIDLRKVFDNYYLTKQADANLKEEAADLDEQRKEMVETFKKGEEEWKKLLDKANDQAVSSEEREKSKQTAEQKLLELKRLEQTIAEFERNARAKLNEKQRRMRDKILQKIREVINARARSEGYTLVLDTAAESVNNTPIVLFASQNEISDAVLNELNSEAPTGAR